MRTFFRLLFRLLFRFEAFNESALATPGPVLLIPNHVSWLDWLFLYAVLERDWKVVTSLKLAEAHWVFRKFLVNRRTFPVNTMSPYAVRDMADHLQKGGRLVLFAEGRISGTGCLLKIYDGTGFLIRKTNAKVITCYLRGAYRLLPGGQKRWWKWLPRVTAHFSDVLRVPHLEDISHAQEREKLTGWLRDEMVRQQFVVEMLHGAPNALAAIAETAASIPRQVTLEDASFARLTYRRLMIATDLLAGAWRARLAPLPGERIGVLLPNVNAMPVALLSLWAAKKVPAILNFSSGTATMLACAQLAGLRHLVTSRQFLERAKLDGDAFTRAGINVIHLEEVRAGIPARTKLTAFARHVLAPGAGLRTAPLQPEDSAVILFTSGSEGAPKGVELTHRNLLANVRQIAAVLDVSDGDRFFSALPLFHSFGLTGGLLFPLVRGCYTFLYPSPLHYRIVPTLVYERACTVLMGTNTFLNGYARKAHPYDFQSVRFLVAGAEKVQAATFDTWARRFGLRILEGYGATECSPVVSVNTRIDSRFGSAGRLLPGIENRLEPMEGVKDGGRLFVRGPNVMKGYLNPEANAAFHSLGGWYDTGDIAQVDADGYLTIRGRVKRFAKVSGEMVSLTAVEDALAGAFPQHGPRCVTAIIAQPDEAKGEKLVAVTNEPKLMLEEIRAAIRTKGLSNLSAPREIKVVDAIPKLGTGKIDHRELERQLRTSTEVEAGTHRAQPHLHGSIH